MSNKVILISIDGMRPDGLLGCGNPYVQELFAKGSYTLNAQTVFPSVTLPCQLSMFHSVNPERHGTTTNTYTPQVRPINGLFEQIKAAGGESALFYGWEQIRDLGRPGSLKHSVFIEHSTDKHTDVQLTDAALKYIGEKHPDFVFLYLVQTDEAGHDTGWMSENYMAYLSTAIDCVKRVIEAAGEEYTVLITADHGGHDRTHGTTMPEDMIIPMAAIGAPFVPGSGLPDPNLKDIAPTVCALLGVAPDEEWEGRSFA